MMSHTNILQIETLLRITPVSLKQRLKAVNRSSDEYKVVTEVFFMN